MGSLGRSSVRQGPPPGGGSVITNYVDIHLTLEDFFGEGDKTAARSTVRFTVAATGQKVWYPVLNMMRWVGDKLVERWELSGPPEEQA